MRKKLFVILAASLCMIFLISCSDRQYIRSEELKKSHDILIIPYKSAPVRILSGSYLVSPLATALLSVSMRGSNEEYKGIMEKMRGDWNPSIVMVKACEDLIKSDGKVQISKMEIANIRELPGLEDLRSSDPNIFSTSMNNIPWMQFVRKWAANDSPSIQYKQEYPQNKSDWVMETYMQNITINPLRESMQLMVVIKIFNINTGEKIALDYDWDSFDMTIIKDESGFKKFEEEFGVAAKKLCGRTLGKTGLINYKE